MLELSAPVIAIVGPTASGKTDAAQIVAERLGGEVVSADSMQIYRGMDIGTGKLAPDERLVPHHGLDLADPGEPYSAALFQEYARACFEDIAARGRRAVLCGGTGLYVRAAIDAYEFPKGEQTGNPVREYYNRLAGEQGADALWELLRERDPASAAIVPAADVKRVVRAFELLEAFFLSCNRDSDLYPGMQQGDNGQSIVLGGMTPDGRDGYNMLSEMCLRASAELRLIDPKINLRVNRDTPLSVYELGTRLTRLGLGFPQYENDDVAIPALEALGYEERDARDYAMAACWEFIIPGKGMEIPNIDAMPFANSVDQVIRTSLSDCADMDALKTRVRAAIFERVDEILAKKKNLYVIPSPFLSLFFEGCVENARDISLGCKYNNWGLHGTGIAPAADMLAAVDQVVFGEGVPAGEVVSALKANFVGFDALRSRLRNAPKMGNDDDRADQYGVWLLDVFADAVRGRRNERGGVVRAGTGTAMYYVSHAASLGATADGREAGVPLPANYAPSLNLRLNGPVSLIKSFTKPHLSRVINGGPLTIEFSDSVFAQDEAIRKVAQLVRLFILRGGHQIQLNTVNRDRLLDAQKHPENYRNLIVRVWGWSGYFVELDKCYQDHIIRRAELTL